jgi:CheY-like chemotaxis protein
MARVGLCEDDPAIRRVVTEGLRLHGHETVVAYDGAEALRRFSDDTLEVLVLDIGLPDADGRDVCVALRSAGQVAPVLFLTEIAVRDDGGGVPVEVRERIFDPGTSNAGGTGVVGEDDVTAQRPRDPAGDPQTQPAAVVSPSAVPRPKVSSTVPQ